MMMYVVCLTKSCSISGLLLWHSMMGISVVMYTANYVSRVCKFFDVRCSIASLQSKSNATHLLIAGFVLKIRMFTLLLHTDPDVQHNRAIKRQAMAEYYEKHGGGDHH
jgi:hypothetical protein